MPNDLNIVLEFKFTPRISSNQIKGSSVTDYIIRDVAFKAGEVQRKNLSKNLQRDLGPIVESELSKMAREISTMAVGLSAPNNSPPGSIKIDGKIAESMKNNAGPMSISSVTGQWKDRTKAYLKWKVKTHKTRKWFRNTGQLQSQLKSVASFRQAYGPMGIKFVPVKGVKPTVSNLGRGVGRPSNFIVTGKIEVRVFRKLDLSDLPQIGQQAKYSKKRLSGFADSVEKKLTGPNPDVKYRPIIEPFLTYYINRKIPNAIFRKIEASVLS